MLLLALIAFGVPLALSLRDRVDSEVKGQAKSQAEVVATSAAEFVAPPQPLPLRRIAEKSAESVRGRVIVVDAKGRLLADSAGAPLGRSYDDRPEVEAALDGSSEQITRDSETLGEEILATSVPILDHGRPTGAVRITQSIDAVHRAVKTSILDIAALAGVVLLLGVVAGALIAQQIARPIRRLDEAARSVAEGDLDTTVAVEGSTEQRSLARAFNEMTQRIKRLLRVQQDFVADATHQLRTPLTGLRLRLEGLAERFRGQPPVERELDAAMGEIDRLALIVDELLILSRAGEHELPGERVGLRAVVERAAARWRATAAERGIELKVAGGSGEGWCAAPDLERALDSLIENALTYSPAGTSVLLEAAPGRIAVLDQGPGLASGEEEAVFERFSRGSAGRQGAKGTGLGLAIARELTRQWGG
ncbi:MAG TPA: ATP-binding protein, partial [Solirubrobacterales bacterium]|nr:ATP-binding protein [Solirubrobacterales bacterium]